MPKSIVECVVCSISLQKRDNLNSEETFWMADKHSFLNATGCMGCTVSPCVKLLNLARAQFQLLFNFQIELQPFLNIYRAEKTF